MKTSKYAFFCFPAFAAHVAPNATTSEINGREAYMWYYYDDKQILKNKLPRIKDNWYRIWYATKENPELYLAFAAYVAPNNAPTSEINGHEASMWYRYDEIHTLKTNYHVLTNW